MRRQRAIKITYDEEEAQEKVRRQEAPETEEKKGREGEQDSAAKSGVCFAPWFWCSLSVTAFDF